jgi:beta-phosphoglucomutase-like phosphatase (HAD superfamily)
MALAAALFDLDGTLADTLGLHYEAYRRVFAEVGMVLPRARFDAEIGGPARDVIPRLVGGQRCPLTVEELHRRKLARFPDVVAGSPIQVLPTAGVLDELGGRVPLGLVTSGACRSVAAVLGRLAWDDRFAVVVTGDDVRRGKPDPEPYLRAAGRLGVRPDACLVFEDSAAGLASATRAGMRVVDVSVERSA